MTNELVSPASPKKEPDLGLAASAGLQNGVDKAITYVNSLSKPKKYGLGCLTILVVMVILGHIIGPTTDQHVPGSISHIDPKQSVVWVCLDEDYWDEMLAADADMERGGKGSELSIRRLLEAGVVKGVSGGSEVRVIDSTVRSDLIVVLEPGPDQGMRGWVPQKFVVK